MEDRTTSRGRLSQYNALRNSPARPGDLVAVGLGHLGVHGLPRVANLTLKNRQNHCSADTLDKMIPFVHSAKVPSPIHAGFRGMQQAKLSTK
jgi:hypothetical protein